MEKTVIQLTRDHDLMRRIVEEMKERLQAKELDDRMIMLIDSLIVIDEIHNEDEMNNLLSNNE